MERQLKLAEAANKLSRDELHYVHRPRLQVRREKIYPTEQGIMGINMVLVNLGALPADTIVGNMNVRILLHSETGQLTKESLPPYGAHEIDISKEREKSGKGALEGDGRMYLFVPFQELTLESKDLIDTGRYVLFFFGYISFAGPDDEIRQSAFFRTYSAQYGTFTASDDPDYEHH